MSEVVASLTKNRRTTLERVEKFLSKEYFVDVNLYGRLYRQSQDITDILHWNASSPSPSPSTLPHPDTTDHASTCSSEHTHQPAWKVSVPEKEHFAPYKLGEPFGPTFSTHFFHVAIAIPPAWLGGEVHLLWDSGSEAMIWRDRALTEPLQALSGGVDFQMRDCFVLGKKIEECERTRELWLEVACNDLFGAGAGGMINPPDMGRMFAVKKAKIAVFDREVWELFTDLEVIVGMAKSLPENDPRNHDAMYLANHIVNVMKTTDAKISEVRKLTQTFFSRKNGDSQHKIFALGHCHIDCAWLWTYDETIRKCGRSWITMVRLMEEYPDFRFVCSSAQQFQWVKDYYPLAYDQIKKFVKNGQFIPVGGTWVEMDGNLPSGEAFIRQFLYGQKFFEEEFGKRCDIFWLPDTFGYSAQLPQIMRLAGIKFFLTQKLSWSLTNQFPHHNFLWRGIDGSEVLVHFPPGDSYGMDLTVADTLKTVDKLKDKGRAHQSVLLYGYGDGGGGPTPAMIERGRRMRDVDGLPKVVLNESISDFFAALEKEQANLNTWSGELYLELHNGTYTTQGEIKRKNRLVQNLLRDVEFLDAVLMAFYGIPPVDRKSQWHDLMLQQFHDVLPGSSIGLVNQDANRILSGLIEGLQVECAAALAHLVENGDETALFNATAGEIRFKSADTSSLGNVFHTLPPYSLTSSFNRLTAQAYTTSLTQQGEYFILENRQIVVTLDKFGQISSMLLNSGYAQAVRQCIAPGGTANSLVMFDDVPLYWDAWDCMDYHLEARMIEKNFVRADMVDGSVLVVEFQMSSACSVLQKISLVPDAAVVLVNCTVNWKEKHKFLKMEVDANITSENRRATYEIQHGYVERPAHRNTSWDWAKFEVCCQRWADLSEHGFGVSVLNATNHGFSIRERKMALSLLRAPKCPDADADMGVHELRYAIMPHWGTFQDAGVVQQAIALNDTWDPRIAPLIPPNSAAPPPNEQQTEEHLSGLIQFFTLSNPAVVLDAVKAAENGMSRTIVIRLYEAYGGAATCRVVTRFPVNGFQECDILEDVVGAPLKELSDSSFIVQLRAFEIKTYLLFLSDEIKLK
ncbi:Alpha-mannosidase 2C1 [Hypsibius exemplaris]|uniref:alpha-mannosidase n=1 Tax=Hypsibius exemplaris TaxID=2072580 RepID=A0A1W0WWS9_HYPEX|nr:Alpha-mannosidase 2C1 [Hypsibius exemplaris]